MADNKPNREAPGEVRSNLQVVVRIVLVIIVIALLVGLGFALVRLLSRPDEVMTSGDMLVNLTFLHGTVEGTLAGLS